jgi:hypothetical protein
MFIEAVQGDPELTLAAIRVFGRDAHRAMLSALN